jgi:hypothetical protein
VNALVAQYQQAIGAKKVAEKSAAVELPIADKIK